MSIDGAELEILIHIAFLTPLPLIPLTTELITVALMKQLKVLTKL